MVYSIQDLNLFCDFCSVYGNDKDVDTVLYAFVTWRESDLLEEIKNFKKILTQSMNECNETAAAISIQQTRWLV